MSFHFGTFFLKELIVIIMKEKNIVLQYEILHIYNDRYEFEKTHKRPLRKMFHSILNYKNIFALMCVVSFWILLSFIIGFRFRIVQMLIFVFASVLISITTFCGRYKAMVIKKYNVINIYKKDEEVTIVYKENGRNAERKIDVPYGIYTAKELSDILDYEITQPMPFEKRRRDKLNFYMGIVGCVVSISFFIVLLKVDFSINVIVVNSIILFFCMISTVNGFVQLVKNRRNRHKNSCCNE